jgi:hypothetical protein
VKNSKAVNRKSMNQVSFQSVRQTTTAQGAFKPGQRVALPDGSEWVYVKADSVLAKGSVAVPDAVVSVDTVSSSQDSQGRNVYITEASAGWTAGKYAEGWVYVDSGTGRGQVAKIKDNTADTLELYPEFALSTALSVADSDITIRTPYLVDKAAVTSAKQEAVGIAQVAFSAGDYGWLQTKGDGAVLAGEALSVGAGFTTGDDTTGQVIKAVTAEGPFDNQNLGYCRVANEAADILAYVWINIS